MLTCIFVRACKIVVRKGKFILEVFHSSAEFPLLCLPDSLAICWMTAARQEASPELLAKYRGLPLHWLPGRWTRTGHRTVWHTGPGQPPVTGCTYRRDGRWEVSQQSHPCPVCREENQSKSRNGHSGPHTALSGDFLREETLISWCSDVPVPWSWFISLRWKDAYVRLEIVIHG